MTAIKRKRKKRKINLKHPTTKKLYKFVYATLTGNCCWKSWSKYRGGQPYDMVTPDSYQPGWAIRSVELLEHCESSVGD